MRKRKRNKGKEFGVNLGVLFVSSLILFLIIELLLALFWPQPCYYYPKHLYKESDSLCFEMSPNVDASLELPDFSMEISTNNWGLRDANYSYDSLNDVVILGLGDSFQFGFGVSIEDTFVKRLERKLNKGSDEQKYFVVNGAVSGYGTRQEVVFYKQRMDQIDPDIVFLSFYIGNDITDNAKECIYSVKDGYLVEKGVSSVRIFLNRLNSYCLLKKRILRVPKLSELLYKKVREVDSLELFAEDYTPKVEEAFVATEEALEELADITTEQKTKLILIIIPHRAQVEPDAWQSIIQQTETGNYDSTTPNKRLTAFAREQGIEVIDLLPAFRRVQEEGRMLYFATDNHINEIGHEVIAQSIHNYLSDDLLIPSPELR